MEIKFGIFTKLSTKLSLGPLTSARSCNAWPEAKDPTPRTAGVLALARVRSNFTFRFSVSTFRRTTPLRRYRGVANCESFQGVDERKSGPWSGAIHLDRGERKRQDPEWKRGLKQRGLYGDWIENDVDEDAVRIDRDWLGRLLIRALSER